MQICVFRFTEKKTCSTFVFTCDCDHIFIPTYISINTFIYICLTSSKARKTVIKYKKGQ